MRDRLTNILIFILILSFSILFSSCGDMVIQSKRDNKTKDNITGEDSSGNDSGDNSSGGTGGDNNSGGNIGNDNATTFDYANYKDFFYSEKPSATENYRVNFTTSGLTARVIIYDETTNSAGKNISDCNVDFGDGTVTPWWIVSNTLSVEGLTHYYKKAGRYTVKVYIKTTANKVYTITKDIEVVELPLTDNYTKPFADYLYYGRTLLATEREKRAYDIVLKSLLEFDYSKLIYRSGTSGVGPGTTGYLLISLRGQNADVTVAELSKIIRYINDDDPRTIMLGSSLTPKDVKIYNADKVDNFIISINGLYTDEMNSNYTPEARKYLGSDPVRAYKDDISNIEVNTKKILSKVKPSMTEAEKFKVIHDEFMEFIRYGDAFSKGGGNIVGAFTAGRRGYYTVVCEGYARGMQYLAQLAGIRAIYVEGVVWNNVGGTSSSGGSHAWNYIMIGGSWYGVDPTWDDAISGSGLNYKYFLRGSTFFNTEHTPFKKPVIGSPGTYFDIGYITLPTPIPASDYPYPGLIR